MNKSMITVDEALGALLGGAQPIGDTESVSTLEATGRVLAADQFSTVNVPPLDNTSMDGYAVRTADCASGEARLRVAQRIPAGSIGQPLAPGNAARIFTGAPIPPGADAVVIQEVCTVDGDAVVVRHKPKPGEWIRRAGEDIRAGSRILGRGARLTPQACGLAASVGLATLPVYRRMRVAVFFTGNELVMPGEKLPEGAIYNSNRFTIRGLLQRLGCEVTDLGIIPDSLEATRTAFRRAATASDLIVTSGGMSVGEEDYVKAAVEAEGAIEMWRIAVKPGKPLAFGKVGRAAFIGLPGNPVSLFVTALVFVRPFILRCQGASAIEPLAFPMRADFDWPKPDARREFLRVKLNGAGGLELFPNQGSAVLTSAVFADGLVDNPERHPIARGDMVRYIPFSELLG
jgi:molybdopterin molybdotransferase